MSDGNNLVNKIISEIKKKLNTSMQTTVYHDEPIKKNESYLRHTEPIKRTEGHLRHSSNPPSDNVPEPLRKMKKLAYSFESYHYSKEELFYRQGMAVADYEDNYNFEENFVCYFPTYQLMSIHQLRGYFSWRTKVRHGEIVQTSLSFVYLYLYELINQIGVQNAEDGFLKMKSFWETYRILDPQIDVLTKNWLLDYAVYYNLEPKLLQELTNTSLEETLQILLHYPDHSKEDFFTAVCSFSSYHIENSKFFRSYPDDVKNAVCAVFASLSEFYAKNRKTSFCEKLFGRKVSCSYQIFHSAVFFNRLKYQDYEYYVNDLHSYQCKNGLWSCSRYYEQGKSKELGFILRTLDSRMRQIYGFKSPIKPEPLTKSTLAIIDKEVEKLFAQRESQQKKNAVPQIEIDISKLQKIRQEADITRDKLIVEQEDSRPVFANPGTGFEPASTDMAHIQNPAHSHEAHTRWEMNSNASKEQNISDMETDGQYRFDFEREENAFPKTSKILEENISPKTSKTLEENASLKTSKTLEENASLKTSKTLEENIFSKTPVLDDTQLCFLRCLLHNEDYRELLRRRQAMLTIVVDSINEALYDELFDTAIEFDGDSPKLVEDYIDTLKGWVGE